MLYFLSPLSNVGEVDVSGNRYLPEETIVSVSGVSNQTSIWKLDKEAVKKQIEDLPEVKKATVSIKLPNSVHIQIEEYHRIGYLMKDSNYYPIVSSGTLLEPLEKGEIPVLAPVLINYSEGDELQSIIGALEELPAEINNAISEIHHEPTKMDSYHVRIYMNDGYEVSATSRTLAEKLVHYPSIISQLDPKQKGVIDLEVATFFRPFNSNASEQSDKKDEKKQQ